MQIVIPMAGSGSRFVRAGHTAIKPLIEVDGLPIIEHVVDMFPGEHDFVFIVAEPHLASTPLRAVLERVAPGAQIVAIPPHKLGPVHTALAAADFIHDDEPVILNYCDFSVGWDYAHFKRTLEALNPAGALTAYRGFHPHSLGPNLYAYLRERDHYLLEIKEKGCFTDNRMQEFASSGTYYFQSGALLKETFRAAVERGWQTNGEYYASTPFNLLVEAGQPVYVYELDQFLQWGTPEDLQEYLSWSDYFARYAAWRPSLPIADGAVLVPMAGAGARFRREGYAEPKPLVPVAGVSMVARALATLPPARQWLAACQVEHLQYSEIEQVPIEVEAAGGRQRIAARNGSTDKNGPYTRPSSALKAVLHAEGRRLDILPVAGLTAGQASTCLLARERLDPDAPLLIAPCDTALVYDEERYAALTADPDVDCVVWTFRNHPHANRNPRQYGWVRAEADGGVLGISCKAPLSDDVRGDPGIIGAFWFRQARFFLEAAEALIAQDRRINGEFYVDAAIEVLVEQGRRARIFDVEHYVCLGTPDDVRTFEYWERYFHNAAHHPYGREGEA